jgi:hypothetical protein
MGAMPGAALSYSQSLGCCPAHIAAVIQPHTAPAPHGAVLSKVELGHLIGEHAMSALRTHQPAVQRGGASRVTLCLVQPSYAPGVFQPRFCPREIPYFC